MPNGFWRLRTRRGTFEIRQHPNGRWHVLFESESLGAYATPAMALDDLAGGHTFWPSAGFDPSELGIPDDLGDWEFVPLR